MNRIPRRAWPLSLALLFAALLLPFAGCDSDDPDDDVSADVNVMTYNLYLGADIFDLVGVPIEQIPVVAAQLFGSVQATDFPARAEAIADIIAEENPALIGLQEVTLYRTQTPSDFDLTVENPLASNPPNAQMVAFDFLEILLDELEERGLAYREVATTTNADVEIPSTTDGANFTDIRLTDRDVILAREDVETSNVVEANFEVFAPVPVGDEAIDFLRGYNSVVATVDGVTFTFANAHLEVDDRNPEGAALAQLGQANELREELQDATRPLVLVGDFNSAADGSGTEITIPGTLPFTGTTYDLLTTIANYQDAAERAGETGDTCCQDADLMNDTSDLNSRIDLILYNGTVDPLSAEVVGDEPADRTESGLWPSDHAGVVATLRVSN